MIFFIVVIEIKVKQNIILVRMGINKKRARIEIQPILKSNIL